jgi:4-aminobutyrate aminotransferase
LLVLDEVQCGMGRTGKMYAYEHWGIEPDIICLAKGIASGMPLGALVARTDVMDWPPGSHASTFGGNPVSCRAALATLDLLEHQHLANAAVRGQQLKVALRDLATQSERGAGERTVLANVRGLGLMLAVDVLSAGELNPQRRDAVIRAAFERGLLLLGCGRAGIRFCPPLCVTAEEVATAVGILKEAVGNSSTCAQVAAT